MTVETPLEIVTHFMMDWNFDDYSSGYSAQCLIERLEAAGFVIAKVIRTQRRPFDFNDDANGESEDRK